MNTYRITDALEIELHFEDDQWRGAIAHEDRLLALTIAGDESEPAKESLATFKRIFPHLTLIEEIGRNYLVAEHPNKLAQKAVNEMQLIRLEVDTWEDYDFRAIFGTPNQPEETLLSVVFSGMMPIGGGVLWPDS